jgi:hypothetical protein
MVKENRIADEEVEPVKKDKRILTMLILVGYTFIVAMCSAVTDVMIRLPIMIVAIFLQAIALKNMLDEVYY